MGKQLDYWVEGKRDQWAWCNWRKCHSLFAQILKNLNCFSTKQRTDTEIKDMFLQTRWKMTIWNINVWLEKELYSWMINCTTEMIINYRFLQPIVKQIAFIVSEWKREGYGKNRNKTNKQTTLICFLLEKRKTVCFRQFKENISFLIYHTLHIHRGNVWIYGIISMYKEGPFVHSNIKKYH